MSKPPILLIHGAFCHAALLEPWTRYFTGAGYPCTTPSLPGHDPCDPTALSQLGIADYLAALRDVRDRIAEPPILIGHSMGGLLAQHLACERPSAALVCVASAPPWRLPIELRSLPYLIRSMPGILAGRAFRPGVHAVDFLVARGLPRDERDKIQRLHVAESGRACRSMLLGSVALKGARPACPVLCMSGGDDRIVSRRVGEKLARLYKAEHVVVEGQGHWLIAPSLIVTVADRIRTWLDQQFGDDGAGRH